MVKPGVRIAILAGGLGSRLGGGKAAATLAGRPLLDHALAAAVATGIPVAIVAKPSTVLPSLDMALVLEPEQPVHPLTGLVAALEASPAEAVLALACDMPFVPAPLLSWLAALPDAAMLRADGRLHPFPGRYPAGSLPALREGLERKRPLRDVLSALGPREIGDQELRRFGDPARICFNVNDAADLAAAEAMA